MKDNKYLKSHDRRYMFNEAWYPGNHIGRGSILFRYTVDLTLEVRMGQVNAAVS